MEADPNPIPKIDLLPLATKLGRVIKSLVSFCPLQAPDYMSEHFRQPFEELYDTPVEQQPSLFD